MSDALGSAMGAIGDWGGKALSGIGSGLESFGSGAMNFFGDLFGNQTGQPLPDTPGATPAAMAQSVPNFSADASASAMSPGLFAPTGDFSTATSKALERQLTPGFDLEALNASVAGAGGAPTAGADFNMMDWLKRNSLPAAMMGYSIYKGNQTPSSVEAMERLARQAEARSTTLGDSAAAAMAGHLPGSAMASLSQATEAARTAIRSKYAALGMTGSTAEAQDLAYAEQAALAQSWQMAQQLAQTGLNASLGEGQIANQLYAAILNAETAQGSALGEALAQFASGLVDYDRPQ